MGQYFLIANLDKKEYIHPHNFIDKTGNYFGAKLWEICANKIAGVLPYLLRKSDETGGGDIQDPELFPNAGRWAGDRIVVIGDYDSSELYDKICDSEDWTEISSIIAEEYQRFIE